MVDPGGGLPTDPSAPDTPELDALWEEVRGCTRCAADLPLGPRPVLRPSATARLLIVGQAPGTRVHESGVPWDDPSGDRLRGWMGVGRETFYDRRRIAIMPMGFCYPGRLRRAGRGDGGGGGDAPPRPECAPLWHAALLALMPAVELTLLVGGYAQAYYLGNRRRTRAGTAAGSVAGMVAGTRAGTPQGTATGTVDGTPTGTVAGAPTGMVSGTVSETVARWREFLPEYLPTPHPSWRTRNWVARNPWFESELLPTLRTRVAELTGGAGTG